jgi:hypothetical protein
MGAAAPARAPARKPSRGPAKPRRGAPSRRAPKPRRAPASRGITPPAGLIPAAAARVGDLADSGLMLRLTRGRAWIGLLGLLLAGIVTINVLSLSYTASGGKIAARSETLAHRNAEFRSELTQRLAGPRIEAAAAASGLVVPGAREITYLTAGEKFAKIAADRIEQGVLTSGAAAPETVEPVTPVAPVETVEPAAETVVPAATPEAAPVAPETTAP